MPHPYHAFFIASPSMGSFEHALPETLGRREVIASLREAVTLAGGPLAKLVYHQRLRAVRARRGEARQFVYYAVYAPSTTVCRFHEREIETERPIQTLAEIHEAAAKLGAAEDERGPITILRFVSLAEQGASESC